MSEKQVDVRFGARTAELDAALKALASSVAGAAERIKAEMAGMAASAKSAESRIEASATGVGGAFARMRAAISSSVSGVTGVIGGMYRSIFSVHTAIAGLVGGGIVATVTGALHAAAAIKDVANAADISTGALQELRFAAAQNGASAEVLDDALVKLNKNLGEFRTSGAGPAAQALEYLGLAQDVTANKFANSEEAFTAVLRKISEVPVAADRAALAADLFGKSAGPKMAEMLAAGEEGIRKARQEAQRLGLVISDEMIQKADEAEDQLNALWEVLKTKGVQAIVSNADAIKQFAIDVMDSLPQVVEQLRQWAEYLALIERTPLRQAAKNVRDLESQLTALRENGGWRLPGMPDESAVEYQLSMARAVLQVQETADKMGRDRAARGAAWQTWTTPPKPRTRYDGVDPKGGGGEDPAVSLARSAAQQQIEIERNQELAKTEIWRQSLQQRHDLKTISDATYITQLEIIAAHEYAVRRKALQDELDVENIKPQERQKIHGELQQLEIDHQLRLAEIRREYERMQAEARQAEILAERQKNDEIARDRERLTGDVESFTNRLLSSQMTANDIMMQLAQQAQQYIVKLIAQRVATFIMGEQAQTTAAVVWSNVRRSVGASENKSMLGAQVMKALKSIATAAAETFANVYAYFSPMMGPFAAIPAGVAAAAVGAARLLIPSARGGTEVTADGLHMLHEKEVVLPAHWTRRFANLADSLEYKPRGPNYPSLPGFDAGGSGDGSPLAPRAYSLTVHAMDAGSVRDFFRRHGAEIGQGMHRIAADGHFRPA